MDLKKHLDFFDPLKVEKPIHIIGCGAIGSNLGVQLAKLGCSYIHLWDFDDVEEHNITNQAFNRTHLNQLKVDALATEMSNNNPDITIIKHPEGWKGEKLTGYVFMAVDSMELRSEILTSMEFNMKVEAVFDGRIGLADGQSYAAIWSNETHKKNLMDACDFKDSEVEVPMSACGTTYSVMPSVQVTVSYMVSNFINLLNTDELKQQIHFDAFEYQTRAVK